MKVLYLEDNYLAQKLLEVYVTNLMPGTKLICASNAGEAEKVLKDNKDIKIAIIDIMLNGYSGDEFIKKVHNRFKSVKFILLSCVMDIELFYEELKKYNVIHAQHKPMGYTEAEELCEVINSTATKR